MKCLEKLAAQDEMQDLQKDSGKFLLNWTTNA